jgi:hypothetical protein
LSHLALIANVHSTRLPTTWMRFEWNILVWISLLSCWQQGLHAGSIDSLQYLKCRLVCRNSERSSGDHFPATFSSWVSRSSTTVRRSQPSHMEIG